MLKICVIIDEGKIVHRFERYHPPGNVSFCMGWWTELIQIRNRQRCRCLPPAEYSPISFETYTVNCRFL